MSEPKPYETYQGVRIFLYQEVGWPPDDWGASIEWQGCLIDIEVENGACPALEHILATAHRFIDALKQVEAQ